MGKDGEIEVNFRLKFKTIEFSSLDLPIEVRKFDLALVDKTLSSKSISIEPGEYVFSTVFPAGQKITQIEKISKSNHEVIIKPPEEIQSPHETHEEHYFINTDFNKIVRKLDLGRKANLRFFLGNPLSDRISRLQQLDRIKSKQFGNEMWEIAISQSRNVWAQFVQPKQPPLNLALPDNCKLIVTPNPDGTHKVFIQLQNNEATLILRYWEEGFFDQVNVLSHSKKVDPEELLRRKFEDPIAATVGAYTILRFGELERLHNWTENLKNMVHWLPDGATIRGEHLARIDKNEEALSSFLLLADRGLPLFSDGLNYALSRLRKYKSEWSNYFGNESKKLKVVSGDNFLKTKKLLDSLQKFEPFVNFKKPILTFTGIDPNNPDNRIVEGLPEEEFDFNF